MRTRKRPIAIGENTRIPARPLLLVERELEARIEAETAAGFRQRRRAAKIARRIAALPPTVFAGDPEAVPSTEMSTAQPTPASPTIVDLPADAVREVTSRSVADHEAEAIVDHSAEPVADHAAELVVEDVEIESEVAIDSEEVVVDQAATSAPEATRFAPTITEPADPAEPVAQSSAEPVPVDPIVVPAPEPLVAVVEPVVEPAPVATMSWQRPNSAWIDRVFSSAHGIRRTETVTWPRPRTTAAPIVDPAVEPVADRSGEAAG